MAKPQSGQPRVHQRRRSRPRRQRRKGDLGGSVTLNWYLDWGRGRVGFGSRIMSRSIGARAKMQLDRAEDAVEGAVDFIEAAAENLPKNIAKLVRPVAPPLADLITTLHIDSPLTLFFTGGCVGVHLVTGTRAVPRTLDLLCPLPRLCNPALELLCGQFTWTRLLHECISRARQHGDLTFSACFHTSGCSHTLSAMPLGRTFTATW